MRIVLNTGKYKKRKEEAHEFHESGRRKKYEIII